MLSDHIPDYVTYIFIFTTFLTIFLFLQATHFSKPIVIVLLAWITVQAFISLSGFYVNTDSFPPRFALLVAPPIACIIGLFIVGNGRVFLDNLDERSLTLIHIVRIPVELVLYWLFIQKTIPQIMTFEGKNFDILAGISAPFIYYFTFKRMSISSRVLLIWNVICLILLLNIVIIAALSIPFRFQQFGFDQPNVAILHFPFSWLPCCIVPLVFLSHATMIHRTLKKPIA